MSTNSQETGPYWITLTMFSLPETWTPYSKNSIPRRKSNFITKMVNTFLNNSISVEQLAVALRLGKLGEQVVVKSQEAFGRLKFTGFSTAAAALYYPRRQARNDYANREFDDLLSRNDFNGLYMNTILAQRIGNDDERIPRNIAP